MSDSPILVVGARGKTGRRVAAQLDRLGHPYRAASRSGEPRFDLADRDTWGPALAGAGAVYLVPMAEAVSASTVAEFLTEATRAGTRRVTLLSARGPNGEVEPYQEPIEQAVRATRLEWTILRPAWFSQNFSEDFFLDPLLAGELAVPTGEGREPFIDAEDIADVAVAALTGDGHAGEVYELTGPEALSFRTATAMIAEATGRAIRFTPLSRSEYAIRLKEQGVPAEFADLLADLLDRIGDGDYVTDGVQRALGREPRPFAEYVKAAAQAGAWND